VSTISHELLEQSRRNIPGITTSRLWMTWLDVGGQRSVTPWFKYVVSNANHTDGGVPKSHFLV